MRARSASRSLGARPAHGGRCAVRVPAHRDGGGAVGAPLRPWPWGTEDEPVCAGGHGLPCGPGPGREAAPGDAGLQRGAGHPQVPLQRLVGCRVPEADGQPPHQSPGDLRPAGQQFPPPHPDGCRSAVSGGSPQVPGLHLRPPARCPQHPGHQEPGHRLRGILAHL